MAITRGATISEAFATATHGGVCDVAHTVDASTTLLVVTTMFEAAETVVGTPQWSLGGGENLTLVDSTTSSSTSTDVALETWALVNPTAGAGTVTIAQTDNDVFVSTAVNYIGTEVGSVGAAILFIAEDVNDGGSETDTISFSSAGTAGNTLYAVGLLQGGDGETTSAQPASFATLFDDASGGSLTSDVSYCGFDYIGGAAAACSWTWLVSDSCAAHYFQIVPAAAGGTAAPMANYYRQMRDG